MKFLVLTDLHQKTENIPWINGLVDRYSPDAVLYLGDITDLGTAQQAKEIISQFKGKVYAVPGNCDTPDTPEAISGTAVDMHGKSATVGGYYIAGLGGGNTSPFNSPVEYTEEQIDSMLRPISRPGMVLMTHAPAYDTMDHIPNGTPVGSTAIRKIIDEFHPIVALSGHIHEDFGMRKVGSTVCINPGPAMDKRAAMITLDGTKVDVEMIGPE